MKNQIKKFLCVLLVVTMLAGLGVSAFAANADNVKQYKNYLCLGDSISAGCGVPFEGVDLSTYDASLKYWAQMYHGYGFVAVPRAYHSLVADAVGANLIQGGISGNRTVEMRYLLDGVYNDSDDKGYWGMVFFGSDGTVADTCAKLDANDALLKSEYGVNFKEAAKTADLITINLGSNDVLSYSAMLTMASLDAEYESNCLITNLLEKIVETGDVYGIFAKFLELANTAGKLNEVLTAFAKSLTASSIAFKTNYKAIVKDIYKVNPNATVVAVGIYNPFNQFILSDSINLKVGKIMDPVVADLNLFLKTVARGYAGCKFADCSKTEIYDFNKDNISSGDYITKVHPTLAGHVYMTNQILSVLPEKETAPEESAKPEEKPTPDKPAAGLPFEDVPANYWAYDEIAYVYDNGIMQGTTKTTFSPEKYMTRAEFATVLYRLAGADASGMKEPFADVDNSYWAHDAIAWAYNEGIITGFDANHFRPDAKLTRAQLVTMLYRYEGSPAVKGNLNQFRDKADIAAPYKDAVIWATQNGIVNGYTDGTFSPNSYATRAHMAVIIERYCTM